MVIHLWPRKKCGPTTPIEVVTVGAWPGRVWRADSSTLQVGHCSYNISLSQISYRIHLGMSNTIFLFFFAHILVTNCRIINLRPDFKSSQEKSVAHAPVNTVVIGLVLRLHDIICGKDHTQNLVFFHCWRGAEIFFFPQPLLKSLSKPDEYLILFASHTMSSYFPNPGFSQVITA
jgi:hypothetical protein